jgi:hypothetical protein
MGIRADPAAMLRQLELRHAQSRKELFFHRRLQNGELPQSSSMTTKHQMLRCRFSQHLACFLLYRLDIRVQPEQVFRVIFGFYRGQACIVTPIGSFNQPILFQKTGEVQV